MPKPNITIDVLFHALGDPTRRAIFLRLSNGPQSVSRLAGPFGITLTAIVQHLNVLENSGLVQIEKVGRVRTCRVNPTGLNMLEKWIHELRSQWERRLDRLGELLDEED